MNLKLAYCNMTVQRVEFVDMCIRLPAGKIVHIATAEDLIRPDYLNPWFLPSGGSTVEASCGPKPNIDVQLELIC
jgi:hypothetical protein